VEAGDSIMSTLAEVARLAVEDSDMENTAEALVAAAMRCVDCDFGGLTVFGPKGQLSTMAATSPVVEQADALQYELAEGPCVAAAWDRETYVSNDVANDPRWPNWGPKAAALGFSSLLATRLSNGDQSVGAMNLYSSRERDFTAEDRDFAQVFAVHATSALLAVRQRENLRVAMDARTLIGQAQGILMERFDIDADKAFAVLRRYSQTRNLKVRHLAAEIVSSRTLPDEQESDLPA
jgi:GAF domain-containing protein